MAEAIAGRTRPFRARELAGIGSKRLSSGGPLVVGSIFIDLSQRDGGRRYTNRGADYNSPSRGG
jgi:hypothetical protein